MDAIVDVVVEVLRGSRNKYEVDELGGVRFDRRLPGAFAFPADYGYVRGAVGTDANPSTPSCSWWRPPIPASGCRPAWWGCSG